MLSWSSGRPCRQDHFGRRRPRGRKARISQVSPFTACGPRIRKRRHDSPQRLLQSHWGAFTVSIVIAAIMSAMREFIEGLSKAELHLHLEGSIEPETVLELDPALSIDEVGTMYRYADFAGFLAATSGSVRSSPSLVTMRSSRGACSSGCTSRTSVTRRSRFRPGNSLEAAEPGAKSIAPFAKKPRKSPVQVYWVFDSLRQFGVNPRKP